jgi:hypothetical protein
MERHPARDPPPPVGAIRALGRFHVLPGDQRQQRHRLGGSRIELLLGQVPGPVRITDQGIQQLFAGGRVVPRDRRLARPLVVMPGAVLPDDRTTDSSAFATSQSWSSDDNRPALRTTHRGSPADLPSWL